MADRILLVTFEAGPDQRATLEAELPAGTDVRYLADWSPDDHPGAVADADALLSRLPHDELSDAVFDRLHDGQVMQATAAGIDHLPLDRFPEGFVLLSNAGAYAEPMAEHVLAMYLALSKRLLAEHRKLAAGTFDQFEPNREVAGSTCAILGFGAVGEATARLLSPLGVSVRAINRSGESTVPVSVLGTPDDLEAVVRGSDVLVIAAALTPETRGLVDAEVLSWLPDDGILINVARGEIVVQRDLYEHLEATPEFRAGLDAWWTEPVRHGRFELEYPFLSLPNVLGSPHNSAQVPEIRERGLRHAARNVAAALAGEDPENVVDLDRGY